MGSRLCGQSGKPLQILHTHPTPLQVEDMGPAVTSDTVKGLEAPLTADIVKNLGPETVEEIVRALGPEFTGARAAGAGARFAARACGRLRL